MGTKIISDTVHFYGDKPGRNVFDNSVWQNILNIPMATKIEEAGLYDIVIHTMWLEAIGWHKEIKKRWPQIILIGQSDHPLGTHISRLPAKQQFAYIEDLSYCDGIMALTEEERQWYQTAVPSIPVERVGLPFPVEAYEQKYGSLRVQPNERDIIGLGVGAADNDRNFVSNILAFRKLQLVNPDLKGVFLSIPSQLLPYCSFWADKIPNLFIQEREDMPEFYEMLARCKFVINLTDRNTPGRLEGEAAFFDVPVIGSNRLELQNELFPGLAVTPFAIEEVVTLGQKLLDDPDLSAKYAQVAHMLLVKNYNYDVSRERFNKLLKRIEGE